jgi:hypothetical protein
MDQDCVRQNSLLRMENFMKMMIAAMFALSLIGATAANADGVGAGVHIGGVGVGVHVGDSHRHCVSWGRHRDSHERYCRRWSR